MTEENFWYAMACLAVNIAMFIIPLIMLINLRNR